MRKYPIPVLAFVLLVAAWGPAALAAAINPNEQVADAAKKFLATLDDAQRGKVVYDYKDSVQRARWSNLPISSFQRGGLRMGDLSTVQRDAAMAVLAAALSPQGYEKIVQIVESDEALRQGAGRGPAGGGAKAGDPKAGDPKAGGPKGGDQKGGGPKGDPKGGKGKGGKGGPGGGGANFGRDEYFISFLGQPSTAEPWMIQFGGHHLGINVTLVGDQATLAPSHTGVQPARYEFEGKEIRPLGREVDKGLALVRSLDEAQRKQAVLGFEVRDLVLGPGRDGRTIAPEGIKGSALTEKQRQMLMDLAGEWTGIMHESIASAKMEQMTKSVGETWFAWSGPTEENSAGYFRIQGPAVFIELAPQRLGGDLSNHIHTIYRDPTGDYGAKSTKP